MDITCPLSFSLTFQHITPLAGLVAFPKDYQNEQEVEADLCNKYQLLMSDPKPLVSTEASSGACPVMDKDSTMKDVQNEIEQEKRCTVQNEDGDKNVCPRSILCKMKKPNSRTWWVSCCKCSQWYHIRCVNLTKKKAQNESFTCENC